MPTDLPEPVVPATSRCGMRARSARIGSPPMSLPSARASLAGCLSHASEPSSSDRNTVSRLAFGTSMPMTLRPGTVAMRTAVTDMERATSSARPITRAERMPGAGSSSYSVTTGPGRMSRMTPCTPYSSSTDSSSRALACSESSLGPMPARGGAAFSSDSGGSRQWLGPASASGRLGWRAGAGLRSGRLMRARAAPGSARIGRGAGRQGSGAGRRRTARSGWTSAHGGGLEARQAGRGRVGPRRPRVRPHVGLGARTAGRIGAAREPGARRGRGSRSGRGRPARLDGSRWRLAAAGRRRNNPTAAPRTPPAACRVALPPI